MWRVSRSISARATTTAKHHNQPTGRRSRRTAGAVGAGNASPVEAGENEVMHAGESVTNWLPGVRVGDGSALAQLWSRYYQRLVALARRRLGPAHRGICDEEDIAAEAMQSFFRRARAGSYPELGNRDELWRLLAAITKRKAINQLRHDHCRKRYSGETQETLHSSSWADEVVRGADADWSPEEQVIFRETLNHLLAGLSVELREIAIGRLQGYTLVEIAGQIGRSVPTVERRLRLIREYWQRRGASVS